MTTLSIIIQAHNEAGRLPILLPTLNFADEIIVLCDRCTDDTATIARAHGAIAIEGAWEKEGDRLMAGFTAAKSDWLLQVDADEIIPPPLGKEIRETVNTSQADYHFLLVDNYIGGHLVRHGWAGSFGTSKVARLFRRGHKTIGPQYVHPAATLTGKQGADLKTPFIHQVDDNISDMLRRLDRYSTLRAKDIREGLINLKRETLPRNIIRFFSRFYKAYYSRGGNQEGLHGILIALMAGLFPLLSYLKAKLER